LRWLLIRKQKGLRNPFVIEGVIHVMLMFRFLCEATNSISFRFLCEATGLLELFPELPINKGFLAHVSEK
jgi:hypothetical protein